MMVGNGPGQLPPSSAAATFLFFLAIMGTRPIVSLLAQDIGMSTAEIGALTAVFALLSLFGASSAGAWMDRRGARLVMLTGTILTLAGLVFPWVSPTRMGLYLSQLVSGTGFTLYTISAQRLAGAAGRTPDESQSSINGFSFMVSMGSFAGPSVLGVVAQGIGLTHSLMAMILPLGLCVILVMRGQDTPHRSAQSGDGALWANPRSSLRYHPFMLRAFMISTFVLLARDSFVAFFPLHASDLGVSTAMIGLIVGIHNLGSLVSRFFLMPCVRAFGRNATVIGSIILAGVFCLLLPVSDTLPMMVFVAFGMGLGLGVGQPLSIAITARLAPLERIGEVLGARLAFNRLTQIVAPLSFGAASAYVGLAGVFWLTGALMILGSFRLAIPDTASSGG